MWFETLSGFVEESPEQVRANITVDGVEMTSHVNGRRLVYATDFIIDLVENVILRYAV